MPMRRLAGAFALALWAGCSGSPAAPGGPQRLLVAGSPVTLGDETRFASGHPGALLFRKHFDSRDALPRAEPLPPDVDWDEHVALHLRCWPAGGGGRGEPADSSVHGVVARVERQQGLVGVRLAGLPESCPEGPIFAYSVAFPLPRSHSYVVRVALALPDAAVLEFGYGIRTESWTPTASPTAFRVELRDASGETHALFERTLDPTARADRRWFDERLDLAAFSGQSVELFFETARLGGAGSLSLPVWADPTVYSATAAPGRPNVVVLSIDTLRAQSLGAYGYGRDTSPFIDSIARGGTLFENAIAPSATTAPSHMSLFTGLYPVRHGVVIGFLPLSPGILTLPQHFRAAGYRTAAFTENGYLSPMSGFAHGFGEYTENHGGAKYAPGEVRRTVGQALRWLERNRQAPFFLFVHTYQVHSPYAPPPEVAGLFADDGFPGPADPAVRRERDDYDREIRYVDDHVRELFAGIEAALGGESTLAVILSDHGEEFAEHGLLRHGAAVYDEVLRVPLIFWGPGLIPAGQRIAAQVSLVDVAPTILALAGLEPPPALDGESLAAAIRGAAPIRSRTLFAEARADRRLIAPRESEVWNPPLIAVRSQDGKLIVHRPDEGAALPARQLDLARDPGELSPRILEGEELARANAAVSGYLGASAQEPAPEADLDAVSPDLVDRLRQLGYVE